MARYGQVFSRATAEHLTGVGKVQLLEQLYYLSRRKSSKKSPRRWTSQPLLRLPVAGQSSKPSDDE